MQMYPEGDIGANANKKSLHPRVGAGELLWMWMEAYVCMVYD